MTNYMYALISPKRRCYTLSQAIVSLHDLHLCDHSPKQRPGYEANEGQDSSHTCPCLPTVGWG